MDLRRLPHRAALEILRLPDTWDQAVRPRFLAPFGRSNKRDRNALPAGISAGHTNAMHLPLYGRIAGTPIEALRDDPTCSMCRLTWSVAAITMRWRSKAIRWWMPVHDGDYMSIQRCTDTENGTIVVALVDREEAHSKAPSKRRLNRPRTRQYQLRDPYIRA